MLPEKPAEVQGNLLRLEDEVGPAEAAWIWKFQMSLRGAKKSACHWHKLKCQNICRFSSICQKAKKSSQTWLWRRVETKQKQFRGYQARGLYNITQPVIGSPERIYTLGTRVRGNKEKFEPTNYWKPGFSLFNSALDWGDLPFAAYLRMK